MVYFLYLCIRGDGLIIYLHSCSFITFGFLSSKKRDTLKKFLYFTLSLYFSFMNLISMVMRKTLILAILACFAFSITSVSAQKTFEGKVLKEVKEWRIDGSKKKLDHVTKYKDGRKVEEIEYSSIGEQKSRTTYTYNENGKCIEEKYYDEYNKLEKTVQFEYFENGKKKSQKSLLPNGKVKSYKEFEYIVE